MTAVWYKPQLSEWKARLIAKCLFHCMNCDTLGYTFSPEAEDFAKRFITVVNMKYATDQMMASIRPEPPEQLERRETLSSIVSDEEWDKVYDELKARGELG